MTDFDHLPHDEQLKALLELARAATKNYALPDHLAVEMISLSENATYRVQASNGQRWALRVHRDGYHSKTAIASELAWLMDLRDTGVVVTPKPVKGIDGEIIQVVAHPQMQRPRFVVLSDWETGVEPGIDHDLMKPFEILGEVTARMWSPLQPLPLSTSNAVEIARPQVATFTSNDTSWQVSEIQLLCASRSPTQRWYYAVHFQTTRRPFATTPGTTPPRIEEIVVCVDFAGRPGIIKPKR